MAGRMISRRHLLTQALLGATAFMAPAAFATVATYVRSSWGNAAPADSADDVPKLREALMEGYPFKTKTQNGEG